MTIDIKLLDNLSSKAKEDSRLRTNFDLRNSPKDNSQRNLNALEPGTKVPIHRHLKSSETCVVIRGSLKSIFFNDDRSIKQKITLGPKYGNFAINIPAGQWHTVEVLEPNTIIFEAKDGKYSPLSSSDVLSMP